jgi:hypothetical protein
MMAWMNAEAVARTLETGGDLLVALARSVLGEGRNLRPCAGAGGIARRLRPGLPAGAGAADRAGLPHQPAVCFYTAVRDGRETELMAPEA